MVTETFESVYGDQFNNKLNPLQLSVTKHTKRDNTYTLSISVDKYNMSQIIFTYYTNKHIFDIELAFTSNKFRNLKLNTFLIYILYKLAKEIHVTKITCLAKNIIIVRAFCNLGFVILNESEDEKKEKCDNFKSIGKQDNADEWKYALNLELEITKFEIPQDWNETKYESSISELRDTAILIKEELENKLEEYTNALGEMQSEFVVIERDTLFVLQQNADTNGLVFTYINGSGIIEYDEQHNAGQRTFTYVEELQKLCIAIDKPLIARNVVTGEEFFSQVSNGFQEMTEKKKKIYIFVPSPESLSGGGGGGGSGSYRLCIGFGVLSLIVVAFLGP